MSSRLSSKGAVVARLMGGLGNQLFIYAASRRLSFVNNVPLKLDISGYSEDQFDRSYSLGHFKTDQEFISHEDANNLNLAKKKAVKYHVNKFLPFKCKTYIRENSLFDPRLLTLKVDKNVYLDGYWQDENYFEDIEAVIRSDLEIVSPIGKRHLEFAKKINAANAVCIHARRINYEHLLTADYYDAAVKLMAGKVQYPHFFCFADDISWIKANIKIEEPVTYIENDAESKDYEILWLMMQCNHYIIANSTYSWWAAWLNSCPEKIVIAPRKWGYRASVPERWISL